MSARSIPDNHTNNHTKPEKSDHWNSNVENENHQENGEINIHYQETNVQLDNKNDQTLHKSKPTILSSHSPSPHSKLKTNSDNSDNNISNSNKENKNKIESKSKGTSHRSRQINSENRTEMDDISSKEKHKKEKQKDTKSRQKTKDKDRDKDKERERDKDRNKDKESDRDKDKNKKSEKHKKRYSKSGSKSRSRSKTRSSSRSRSRTKSKSRSRSRRNHNINRDRDRKNDRYNYNDRHRDYKSDRDRNRNRNRHRDDRSNRHSNRSPHQHNSKSRSKSKSPEKRDDAYKILKLAQKFDPQNCPFYKTTLCPGLYERPKKAPWNPTDGYVGHLCLFADEPKYCHFAHGQPELRTNSLLLNNNNSNIINNNTNNNNNNQNGEESKSQEQIQQNQPRSCQCETLFADFEQYYQVLQHVDHLRPERRIDFLSQELAIIIKKRTVVHKIPDLNARQHLFQNGWGVRIWSQHNFNLWLQLLSSKVVTFSVGSLEFQSKHDSTFIEDWLPSKDGQRLTKAILFDDESRLEERLSHVLALEVLIRAADAELVETPTSLGHVCNFSCKIRGNIYNVNVIKMLGLWEEHRLSYALPNEITATKILETKLTSLAAALQAHQIQESFHKFQNNNNNNNNNNTNSNSENDLESRKNMLFIWTQEKKISKKACDMVETLRKQPQWNVLTSLHIVFCATSSLWPIRLVGLALYGVNDGTGRNSSRYANFPCRRRGY